MERGMDNKSTEASFDCVMEKRGLTSMRRARVRLWSEEWTKN